MHNRAGNLAMLAATPIDILGARRFDFGIPVSNRSRFCQLTAVPAAYPHVGDLIQINFAKPAKNT